MTASAVQTGKGSEKGPKYTIIIEGKSHPWDQDTITTEQIAELGGWDPSVGVIEIDKENNERTLQPGEVVQLKPGMGFGKKVSWKRGLALEERLDRELEILHTKHPSATRNGMWVLVPDFPLPSEWTPERIDIAIYLRPGYPGAGLYGIYVRQELRFQGQPPNNYQARAEPQPPFGGMWGILSWEAERWFATDDPQGGHNLLTWTEGLTKRFMEGR